MAPSQPGTDPHGDAATLHIGLFFDGTRHNAHNLARGPARAAPQPRPPVQRADDDSSHQSQPTSSYDNGATNIVRLHGLYPDSRRGDSGAPSLAVYVEGVGTRDGAEDDLIGLAFGVGATGVRAKVQRALQVLLPAALAQLASHVQAPLRGVQVDLFGYSRGAAAARDAAHSLQQWDLPRWRQLLQTAGLACGGDFAPARPLLRFIGLFETVVAVNSQRPQERPRVDLPAGIAGQVLQLRARDEHRHHFALTSVAPPHREVMLPGTHADIGGGHAHRVEGPKLLSRPRRQVLRQHALADFQVPPLALLQASEVYTQAQDDAQRWRHQLGLDASEVWVDVWHQWQRQRRAGSDSVLMEPTLYVSAGVVLRRAFDWRYQLVPLQIMQTQAAEAGVRWRSAAERVPRWELPDELQPIARRLRDGQQLGPEQEALLRRRYLGQSAHWNFDALGDTALTYAADAGVSELPYRPGPGLFYINRPSADGMRVVLPNQ